MMKKCLYPVRRFTLRHPTVRRDTLRRPTVRCVTLRRLTVRRDTLRHPTVRRVTLRRYEKFSTSSGTDGHLIPAILQ